MIEQIKKYKSHIFKDIGLYISLFACFLYLIIYKPWINNLNIYEERVWIISISFPIIALAAAFCYQSKVSSREIVNNLDNEFHDFLLNNGILDEILFLYRCNISIGMSTIVILIIYNILVFSDIYNNMILGIIAIFPIFLIVWLLSEFRHSNKLETKLDEYKLEYKKIKNLKNF